MLDDAIKKVMGINVEKSIDSNDLNADWLPVELAKEFIDIVREKNWCRQLFKTINMPGATFDIPKLSSDASVYYVSSENTAPTAESKPAWAAAGSVRLIAKKIMAYVTVSNEVDEDSRIAIVPIVRDSFAASMAAAEEKAFIQGDDALGWAAGDVRKAFDGLVNLAGKSLDVETKAKTGGLEVWEKAVELARYELGVYGRDPRSLILLVNPYSAALIRQYDKLLTLDKYGPKATIFNGEIGKLMGITVIEHPYIPEDNSTPVTTYDTPGVADKGVALLLRKDSPLIGDRRKVRFDHDKVVSTDSVMIAVSERIGFAVQEANAICLLSGLNNSIG